MIVILMYRKANIFALNVLLNILSAILTISFFLLFKSLIVQKNWEVYIHIIVVTRFIPLNYRARTLQALFFEAQTSIYYCQFV